MIKQIVSPAGFALLGVLFGIATIAIASLTKQSALVIVFLAFTIIFLNASIAND